MGTRTRLLLSGGILAIVALLGASNVSAQAEPPPPLVTSIAHQTMANGCSYLVTVNAKGEVIGMAVDLDGPDFATVFPNEACEVVVGDSDICEDETGLAYCPPVKRGRQPIQGVPGGIFYYPKNIKVTC